MSPEATGGEYILGLGRVTVTTAQDTTALSLVRKLEVHRVLLLHARFLHGADPVTYQVAWDADGWWVVGSSDEGATPWEPRP